MDNTTTLKLSEKYGTPYIVIPPDFVDMKKCAFRLYYGEKFVVIVCNSVYRQIEIIRESLAYYIGTKRAYLKDVYRPLYEYIKDNPGKKFRFELISVNESPYRLLQKSQIAIDEGILNGNCLNLTDTPKVSRYIQAPDLYLSDWEKKFKAENKWINRGHYLNFRKWQYNRNL